jgi:NAD(P)-dependent dehydrogenase (short-subunit alcohol dehydrogenase family)
VSARFADRVVVITGAARGLGRDYARFFAADGAAVVVADIGNPEPAVSEVTAAGGRAIGVETDITSPASAVDMVKRTLEAYGRLDVLVNNAGVWRGLAEAGLLAIDERVWRSAWDVNVSGTLYCTQAAVPAMAERNWGRVVNISSMASRQAGNIYGLTKNAVERLTEGLAREVGGRGITVNCVAPGICAFEAARSVIPGVDDIVARSAVARLGTSRDLYGALQYLCSDAADWVSGQTLRVDGGAW